MSASVPSILLIGNGRLARHLAHDWAQALPQYRLERWNRSQSIAELYHHIPKASVIALAISDSALNEFVRLHHSINSTAHWIHFSGALEVANATGFHPLMSFGPELYEPQVYRQIPYVTVSKSTHKSGVSSEWPASFTLPNPLYAIASEQKALYHALCVLSANFSTLLWAKAQTEFEKLGLDPLILKPISEITSRNVFRDRNSALTGPLIRKDVETQQKNLLALKDDPFHGIYLAFQKAFQQEST